MHISICFKNVVLLSLQSNDQNKNLKDTMKSAGYVRKFDCKGLGMRLLYKSLRSEVKFTHIRYFVIANMLNE